MEKNIYFSSWTVKQLKCQSHNLGLKMSGNKRELIQRICENEVIDNRKEFLTDVNDTDYKIQKNLDTEDLLNIRVTNKYANKLCTHKEFLRLRLQRNHSGNPNKALVDAASYDDLIFAKYLVEHHDVYFSYNDYAVYWESSYDVRRYVIKTLDITADDLLYLLKYAATSLGDESAINVIQSGLVNKVINTGYNISIIYDKVIKILIDDAARYDALQLGDLIEYLKKMKYLYETEETSAYLKMPIDL